MHDFFWLNFFCFHVANFDPIEYNIGHKSKKKFSETQFRSPIQISGNIFAIIPICKPSTTFKLSC